jgi:predicted TIM-barrel fold metal-dependent hydrolase
VIVDCDTHFLPPDAYDHMGAVHFTIETEEEELGEAISLFGATQFLFATDYPYDDPGGRMKFKDVELLDRGADISATDKQLILCGNALRLLGAA